MSNQDSPTADKFAANLRAIAADEDCPTVLEPFAIEAADRIESLTRELTQTKRELEQSRASCLLMKNAAQELNRELVQAKEQIAKLKAAQPSIESQAQMLERALQTVMARLADLLDEDQFKQIEAIVLKAGVPPPQSEPQEAMRGFCGLHLWGAPEGKDDMPCPYCTGELRSRLG